MNWPLKIQGRFLSEKDVMTVDQLIKDNPSWNRTRLSRELCAQWEWQRPDGQMKDMACRELLRKLESRALIKLPPRRSEFSRRHAVIEPVEVDQSPLSCRLSEIMPVRIVNVRDDPTHEPAFKHLMKSHHYLGYGRPVGQNMRYVVLGPQGQYLGCVLFGAAAWKLNDRDQWIGWSADVRERNIGLICNNTRFLILDWIQIPHLASHVLGRCLRRLSKDWMRYYGTEITLVETFVDTSRYVGTCYKAANWLHIGQSKGRTRQDRERTISVPIKNIFVYPLQRDFRKLLCS